MGIKLEPCHSQFSHYFSFFIQLNAIFPIYQGGQIEHSAKTLRSPLSIEFDSMHYVSSGGSETQRRALP